MIASMARRKNSDERALAASGASHHGAERSGRAHFADAQPRSAPTAGGRGEKIVFILSLIAALAALAIVAGTVYGIGTGSRAKKLAREASAAALSAAPDGRAVFTGVGRLRAVTRDAKPAIVVATVSFPYPADDRPFAEELKKKAPALKAAAIGWLSARRAAELHPAYEGTVKAGLRDSFNELLSLGRIEEIWLSDFSVIE